MNDMQTNRGALRDDVERALGRHWSEVLRRPVGDRFADFFSLGGQSLTAMRLISCIEREMHVRLTLAELLVHPTLAEQATLVRERRERREHIVDARQRALTAMRPGGAAVPIVLIPPWTVPLATQMSFVKRILAEFPVYGFQPPGLLPGTEPARSIAAEVDQYFEE